MSNVTPVQFARPFVLHRRTDVSGVSGTGIVADGVAWPDGSVSVRWRGERPSIVFWDSLDDAIAVHGHQGATRIVWADETDDGELAADAERAEAVVARVEALAEEYPVYVDTALIYEALDDGRDARRAGLA